MPTSPNLVLDSVISRPLQHQMQRMDAMARVEVVMELNGDFPGDVDEAREALESWLRALPQPPFPVYVDGPYVTTALTSGDIQHLVARNSQAVTEHDKGAPKPSFTAAGGRAPRYAIHRMWPNFTVRALITRSVVTTKCDAAHRSFNATGRGVVWAVMDSGIDAAHEHFAQHGNVDPDGDLHRSFIGPPDADEQALRTDALRDDYGRHSPRHDRHCKSDRPPIGGGDVRRG